MSRVRAWPFTINYEDIDEHDPDEDPEWWDETNIKYISYQYEFESCFHIQGFLYLKEGRTMAQLKKTYNNRAHWEVMHDNATFDEAISYTHKPCPEMCPHLKCGKERLNGTALSDTFYEWGIAPERGDGLRDLKVSDKVATLIEDGFLNIVKRDFKGYYVTNRRNLKGFDREVRSEKAKKRKREKLVAMDIEHDPHFEHWHQQVLDELETQDERHILWVWDEGETGKNLCIGGVLRRDKDSLFGFTLVGGVDIGPQMIYAYDGQAYIHIDVPYTFPLKDVPYALLEAFKNGQAFSSRYESEELFFDTPKVLVTANGPPLPDKIGKNRFTIRNGKDGYALLGHRRTSFFGSSVVASQEYREVTLGEKGIEVPPMLDDMEE